MHVFSQTLKTLFPIFYFGWTFIYLLLFLITWMKVTIIIFIFSSFSWSHFFFILITCMNVLSYLIFLLHNVFIYIFLDEGFGCTFFFVIIVFFTFINFNHAYNTFACCVLRFKKKTLWWLFYHKSNIYCCIIYDFLRTHIHARHVYID